mgnify:CR=1 FL=1
MEKSSATIDESLPSPIPPATPDAPTPGKPYLPLPGSPPGPEIGPGRTGNLASNEAFTLALLGLGVELGFRRGDISV